MIRCSALRNAPILISLLLAIAAHGADPPQQLPSIEDAVRIAGAYVRDRRINVDGRHIALARIERNPQSVRPDFWRVTWELGTSPPVKGSQISVFVYPDRTAQVFYGQ